MGSRNSVVFGPIVAARLFAVGFGGSFEIQRKLPWGLRKGIAERRTRQ